jgi:lipoic acid synthetase/lipoate-protein ligase A
VRQRITLLKDHIPYPIDEVKTKVKTTLCNGELLLNQTDIEGIEQLEQTYLQEAFIHRIQ